MTRFPYCACPHALLHHGAQLRQATIPPSYELCLAGQLRAAQGHEASIRLCLERLTNTSDEFLSVLGSVGPLRPEPGWDTLAHAASMHTEAHGAALPADTRQLLQAAGASQATQARLLDSLVIARYPTPLIEFTEKKARELLTRLSLNALFSCDSVQQALKATFACLRRRSMMYAWLMLRTWTNSWPMAQGMQKGTAGCPHSCAPPAIDSLAHGLFYPVALTGRALARCPAPHAPAWGLGRRTADSRRTSRSSVQGLHSCIQRRELPPHGLRVKGYA